MVAQEMLLSGLKIPMHYVVVSILFSIIPI